MESAASNAGDECRAEHTMQEGEEPSTTEAQGDSPEPSGCEMEKEDFERVVRAFVGHELHARFQLEKISKEVKTRWPNEGDFINAGYSVMREMILRAILGKLSAEDRVIWDTSNETMKYDGRHKLTDEEKQVRRNVNVRRGQCLRRIHNHAYKENEDEEPESSSEDETEGQNQSQRKSGRGSKKTADYTGKGGGSGKGGGRRRRKIKTTFNQDSSSPLLCGVTWDGICVAMAKWTTEARRSGRLENTTEVGLYPNTYSETEACKVLSKKISLGNKGALIATISSFRVLMGGDGNEEEGEGEERGGGGTEAQKNQQLQKKKKRKKTNDRNEPGKRILQAEVSGLLSRPTIGLLIPSPILSFQEALAVRGLINDEVTVEEGGSDDESDGLNDTQGSLKDFIVEDKVGSESEQNEDSDAGDEGGNESPSDEEQQPNGRAGGHTSQPETPLATCTLGFFIELKSGRTPDEEGENPVEDKAFYAKLERNDQTGAGRLYFYERKAQNGDEGEEAERIESQNGDEGEEAELIELTPRGW